MSALPEGKLLVALWKLPGSSRTPLVTELKVPETVSLAERTAASMSKGSGEEEEEASERVAA